MGGVLPILNRSPMCRVTRIVSMLRSFASTVKKLTLPVHNGASTDAMIAVPLRPVVGDVPMTWRSRASRGTYGRTVTSWLVQPRLRSL